MKKILAVGAMAAMLAGAAFAVDFGASATLHSTAATVDTDGNWTLLNTVDNWSSKSWTASVSGERAGATLSNYGKGNFGDMNTAHIWFKPVDMLTLKVAAGAWDGNNYTATLNVSGITLEGSVPGGFISNGAVKGGSYVKVGYANDTIGSVSVKVADRVTTDLDFDGDNNYYAKANSDCELTVAYSKDFGFVNASSTTVVAFASDVYLAEKLDLSTKIADLVSVNCGNIVIAEFGDEASLEYWKTTLGCSTPVGDNTLYINLVEKNWMTVTSNAGVVATLGLKGNLDVMSWDVAVEADVAATTKISIPFTLSVGL